MKIGSLLSAALGAVSLLGGAIGCYVAVTKYNTMSDAREARTRLHLARVMGEIIPLAASERGYTTNIIFAPSPAQAPDRAGLDRLRAQTTRRMGACWRARASF